jgi:hypothetical protein
MNKRKAKSDYRDATATLIGRPSVLFCEGVRTSMIGVDYQRHTPEDDLPIVDEWNLSFWMSDRTKAILSCLIIL